MKAALNLPVQGDWFVPPVRGGVPDKTPEPALDAIAEAAAMMTGAPCALVMLADSGEWRILAAFGVSPAAPLSGLDGLIGEIVERVAPWSVADAAAEPRYSFNPLVAGRPGLRFFAGAPAIGRGGAPDGMLCVFGPEPKSLGDREAIGLKALARTLSVLLDRPPAAGETARSPNSDGGAAPDESHYRLIAENTSDVILLHDRFGRRSYVSPGVEAMLGYDQQEFLSMPVSALCHPEDRESLARSYVALGPDLSAATSTHRLRHKNGEYVWVEAASRLVSGGDLHTSIVSSLRDVSLRKRAEEELRLSEARFRGSFDNAGHGIALVSLTGRWLTVNGALCQMLGYSDAELRETDFQSLTHPDDLDPDLTQLNLLLAGGIESYQLEKRYLHKNGEIVWANLNVSLVRDGENGPLYFVSQVQDITEQKRATEALRRSEARYRTVADNANDLIILQAENLATSYVSPSSWRILGYTPEEVRGCTNDDLIHPDDVDRYARIAASLSAEQPILNSLHRLRRKDGRFIWAEVSLRWIDGGSGEAVRILSVTRDVTARKIAEDEAAANAALLTQAFDSMVDGIALYDSDDRLVFVNKVLRDRRIGQENYYRLGLTYEQVIRIYSDNAPSPLAPEIVERNVANAVALHRRGDGRAVEYQTYGGAWLQIRNIALPGERRLSVTTDISALKQAAIQIAEARDAAERLETLLRDAIEVIDEGIAIYDAEERLIVANSAVCGLRGSLQPFFVTGARFADIMGALSGLADPGTAEGEALLAYAAARLARFRAADGGASEERTDDGRWILCREFRTGEGGTVSVVTDITALKLSAIEIDEARNRAESANRAKSTFLASMSHEIRTPLNGVIGFADLLLLDPLAPAQRERVTLLREAGQSLMAVISDVLDFSKIEAGQLSVERIAMNPDSVVDGALSILKTQIAAKGLTCSVRHAPDVPDWIASDPTRIRQILLNLVGNALKFTSDGGIVVRTKTAAAGDRTMLRFEVEDSGIGVPLDRRHLLCRDFSQVEISTTRNFGGTGLGLAICRRLAEALGGEIGMEDAPVRGSIFWFTVELIPVASPTARISAPPARPADTRRVKVLVAEDLPMNQIIAKGLLRAAGHDAFVVDDGAAAMAAVATGGYDIVLMDMQMPVMDGVAATRAIRAQSGPMRDIPIIALTANAMSDDVQQCLDAGMNDFLVKPINRDALAAVIARWAPDPLG